MTIVHDASHRGWSQGSTHGATTLQDKYEPLKEIGDGSFGSVALARVRGAGSHVARRGTLVCSASSIFCSQSIINLASLLGCYQNYEKDL